MGTMISESSIFPAETVLKAIEEEEYTQYFLIKQPKQQQKQHSGYSDEQNHCMDNEKEWNITFKNSSTKKTVKTVEGSYAQLTALLALAGEEWSTSSEVPQQLCKAITKEIIKYANKHDLDREHELNELLNPLIDYANGRGMKRAINMLPWFAALAVSTVNPLVFYATYIGMLAANSDSLKKGEIADNNTMNMTEM